MIFGAGCYLTFLEAANVDYSEDYDAWERKGRPGRAPRLSTPLCLQHLRSRCISYYGALIQELGSVCFIAGCVAELVLALQPKHAPHTALLARWLVALPFQFAGTCFTLGSFLMAAEASHSWWRGVVPPLRCTEATSADYWVQHLNWLGSLAFCAGGVWGWFREQLTPDQAILLTACSWLLGSLIFVVLGALMYLELINPIW
jgi:hypothetical protein